MIKTQDFTPREMTSREIVIDCNGAKYGVFIEEDSTVADLIQLANIQFRSVLEVSFKSGLKKLFCNFYSIFYLE